MTLPGGSRTILEAPISTVIAMNLRLASIAALAGAVLLGGAFRGFAGQSLADVARQEAARRKTITEPAKVLTNRDLGAVPQAPAPSASTAASSAAPGAPAAGAPPPTADQPDKPADRGPAKDQAYWAKRMKDLKDKLDRDQILAAALQSRVNALTADFSSHDDPVQRAAIGQDRQNALDEFNRMQKTMADDKKAIADLEEEARRAGVPPGWLRS